MKQTSILNRVLYLAIGLHLISGIGGIASNNAASLLFNPPPLNSPQWLWLPAYCLLLMLAIPLLVRQQHIEAEETGLSRPQTRLYEKHSGFVLFFISIPLPLIFLAVYVLTRSYWTAALSTGGYVISIVSMRLVIALWIYLDERRHMSDYRKYLERQVRSLEHNSLSLVGHTLLLRHVFVELQIDRAESERAARRVSNSPLERLEHEQRRYTIWDWLPPMRSRNLVLTGGVGSGKTTLLQNIALTLATVDTTEGRRRRTHIPMLIAFRDLSWLRGDDAHISDLPALPDLIAQTIATRTEEGPPAEWFHKRLRTGRCIVLLDGLDEIIDTKLRMITAAWVQRQMEIYYRSRFVVTSRPAEYTSSPLREVAVLQICPFNAMQRERFIRGWYRATEREELGDEHEVEAEAIAATRASDLLHRLAQPANEHLYELSINPLLLTMIVLVHRFRRGLPEKRAELYETIVDVLVERRLPELTNDQKREPMEVLAYGMTLHGWLRIETRKMVAAVTPLLAKSGVQLTPVSFLIALSQGTGLIVEHEVGLYGFVHRSIQDYLTAKYIRDQSSHALDTIRAHIDDDGWHETIKLYCALTGAAPIIEACLREPKPNAARLRLAVNCFIESRRDVGQALRRQLIATLLEAVDDNDTVRRAAAINALLQLRLHLLDDLGAGRQIDSVPITVAEYSLFLEEVGAKTAALNNTLWLQKVAKGGTGRMPVLGISAADGLAFCAWLQRRGGPLWRYRLPTENEARTFVGMNISEAAYWVSTRAGLQIHNVPQGYAARAQQMALDLLRQDTKLLLQGFEYRTDRLEKLQVADIDKQIVATNQNYQADMARLRKAASASSREVDISIVGGLTIVAVLVTLLLIVWIILSLLAWIGFFRLLLITACIYIIFVIITMLIPYKQDDTQSKVSSLEKRFIAATMLPVILPPCMLLLATIMSSEGIGKGANWFYNHILAPDEESKRKIRAMQRQQQEEIAKLQSDRKAAQDTAVVREQQRQKIRAIIQWLESFSPFPQEIQQACGLLPSIDYRARVQALQTSKGLRTEMQEQVMATFDELASLVDRPAPIWLEFDGTFIARSKRTYSKSKNDHLETLRLHLLLLAAAYKAEQHWTPLQRKAFREEERQAMTHCMSYCLEMYFWLALLKCRLDRKIESVEGIRIMRERVDFLKTMAE